MDTIEQNIKRALQGHYVEERENYCDFSLKDQNEVTASRGVTPTSPDTFVPEVQKSIFYIVAAVVLNVEGEVLMIQEAKSSCAGQWYLPAGRMEAGEDIVESTRREVLEETGLEFQPTTLLMVESAGGAWYRFVLTGTIIGGTLKTPVNSDSESLQAKWVKDLSELCLRSQDIIPVIQLARQYYSTGDVQWHRPILPALRPHKSMIMRVIMCVRKRSNNRVHVLVCEKTEAHLPVCEINPQRSIHSTLKKYITEILGADLPPHRPHGILSIEHTGKPAIENDGLCLTILISVKKALEDICLIDKYTWLEVAPALGEELCGRLAKNMTINLHVVR